MLSEELKKDYTEWAKRVSDELKENNSWVADYKRYAEAMLKNKQKYIDARKLFHEFKPFHYYVSTGQLIGSGTHFDIRYLGQSIGEIVVNNGDVKLKVDKKHSENSKKFFSYSLGVIDSVDWVNSKEAKEFRRFYKNDVQGLPRQKEHMVESALFSELSKTSSETKTFCGIQPFRFANTRFHMKTPLRASDKNQAEKLVVNAGGEIDCLCRRHIEAFTTRFTVIEVKDENMTVESFDKTMYQAISYAVFLRELIKSEAGPLWLDVLGMNQKHYKDNVVIDAVVAMPEGKTKPSYAGDRIDIGDGDFLELHYIEFTSKINADNSEDVVFKHSFQYSKL